MNNPENIIIHHTAVSRVKNFNQFEAVKNYHIRKGWSDIGYHWFIEPDGTIKKGREENKAGAHCSQKGMNYQSIGICLAGNFDLEEPTDKQKSALAIAIRAIQMRHHIPDQKVFYHRYFATYKSCPGKLFTDEILKYFFNQNIMISEETQKFLETNFKPRSMSELRRFAIEWKALDALNAGIKHLRKPENLHDLKQVVVLGRMELGT